MDNPEVHRPALAPRDLLDGDPAADRFHGADDRDEHGDSKCQNDGLNSRSKPGQAWTGTPNHGAAATRVRSKWPSAAATEQPAAIPITGAHRRPQTPGASDPERDGLKRSERRAGTRDNGIRCDCGGDLEHPEDDGHDRCGDQHDDGPGHRGGEDAADLGQSLRQDELEGQGDQDQPGEQRWTARRQGCDADREKRPGGTHQEDVAGTDASRSADLEERRDPADDEDGKA